MKYTHIVHPFAAPNDRNQGGNRQQNQNAPPAPVNAPPVENIAPPVAVAEPLKVSDLVPFLIDGFKMDVGKPYDQKDGSQTQKIADVICTLKGSHASAPFYFMANITRVRKSVGDKGKYEMRMPAKSTRGGNVWEAILKTNNATAKAALDQFKVDTVQGAFLTWARTQDFRGATANASSGGFKQGGVELDIDI